MPLLARLRPLSIRWTGAIIQSVFITLPEFNPDAITPAEGLHR